MKTVIKLSFIFLLLGTITIILFNFLGHILQIATIGGGIVIIAIFFFSIIFTILMLLLALFYALKKTPYIEKSGNWAIERIKGKREE